MDTDAKNLAELMRSAVGASQLVLELQTMPTRTVIGDAVVHLESLFGGKLPDEYTALILKAVSGLVTIVSFTADIYDARTNRPEEAITTFEDVDLPSQDEETGEGPTPVAEPSLESILAGVYAVDSDDEDDEEIDDEESEDDDEEPTGWDSDDEDEEEALPSISLRLPVTAPPSSTMADLADIAGEALATELDLDVTVIVRGFDYTETTRISEGVAAFTAMLEIEGASVEELNGREVVRMKRALVEAFSGEGE